MTTFLASAEPPMGGKWICALSGQGNYRLAMRLATDVVVTQSVKRAAVAVTAAPRTVSLLTQIGRI